jgi:[ribosomal protein S18]-alanine N-acetyltransferase
MKATAKAADAQLRTAAVEDVAGMLALERSEESAAHWEEPAYRQIFEPGAAERIALVLSVGNSDEIAGFVVGRVAAGECELENIVVDREQRRQGFAYRLIDWLVTVARSRSARRVFLEVRESNAAAQALYGKCGFRVVGRRKSYYSDPREDAMLYEFEIG